MPKTARDEPTESGLQSAKAAYEVELLSFERKLEKLDPAEILPRYNRLRLKVRCRGIHTERPLFLTVRRQGSKLGGENFYTEPFFIEEQPLDSEFEYLLLSFDSFALPFENMSVEMCRFEDFMKRRVSISAKNIERRRRLTSRVA